MLIKQLLKIIRALILRIIFEISYPKRDRKKYIFCEGYFLQKKGKLLKRNWGDDINVCFIEMISHKKVVNIPYTKMFKKGMGPVYSLIGSIIGFYDLNNKTIFGSGMRDPNEKLTGIPKNIVSVRGPRTREELLKRGIQCPENYGDPALLLPLFYKPNIQNKKKIGIIPNMASSNNQILDKYNNQEEYDIIDMTNYNSWTEIIDRICSCKYVLSESLHGIIVAETYKIPCVWVEFIQHPSYWDFKFLDFYESIGKYNKKSIQIFKGNYDDEIDVQLSTWKQGEIHLEKIIPLIPF